ncbi:MAG: hypothetical protein EZS28_010182, partial [Streblomastix strix]
APKNKKSRKQDSDSDEDNKDDSEDKSDDGSDFKEQEKPKRKPTKYIWNDEESNEDDEDDDAQLALSQKLITKQQIFDDRHQDEIEQKKEEIEGYNVDKLKKLCKKNDLIQSGNKSELIERVADAMVNGPPERCPKCHGGRLYFSEARAIYYCRGFYDEDVEAVVRCRYHAKKIERKAWKD